MRLLPQRGSTLIFSGFKLRLGVSFVVSLLLVACSNDHSNVEKKTLVKDLSPLHVQSAPVAEPEIEKPLYQAKNIQNAPADPAVISVAENEEDIKLSNTPNKLALKLNDSHAAGAEAQRGPTDAKRETANPLTPKIDHKPVAPIFAFSNNFQERIISSYKLDQRSGMLLNVATITIDAQPISMVLNPNRPYLYVADLESNAVVVFSIDEHSGTLARHSSSKANVLKNNTTAKLSFISIDSKGRFVYVANQLTDNLTGEFKTSISVLAIDKETGLLSLHSSVFPPLNNWSIGASPHADFAYVPSYNDNSITTYSLDNASGALTEIAKVKTGFGPSSVAVSPNGYFVYSANLKSNTVSMFTVDLDSGVLVPQSSVETRTSDSAGSKPLFIEIHPSGKFAYTANYGSGSLSVFRVNPQTGELKATSSVNSTVLPATEISSLTIDPTGQFLYAMTPGSGIWIFSINSDNGKLTEVTHDVGRSDLRIVFTKAT